jgi:Fe-S-cluster containining protein
MEKRLEGLEELAKENRAAHKAAFVRHKKKKTFDKTMQGLHNEVFEKTDCMTCGNCCKTTSPIFIVKDMERIAKHFRMRPSDFERQYIKFDEDDHYVLKNAGPCPFLGPENLCEIYKVRPRACSEYPHTNRKKVSQLEQMTLDNAEICPAVFDILEKLKEVTTSSSQSRV